MYRRSSSSASSRKSTDTEAPTWWRISSISSSSDRSATTSRAPESRTRNARSRARRMFGHGTATRPLLIAPSIAACQEGTFPIASTTRSPLSIRMRMRCAQRAASPAISWNVRRSTIPSRSTKVIAAFSGSVAIASITSRVKLKRAGTSHPGAYGPAFGIASSLALRRSSGIRAASRRSGPRRRGEDGPPHRGLYSGLSTPPPPGGPDRKASKARGYVDERGDRRPRPDPLERLCRRPLGRRRQRRDIPRREPGDGRDARRRAAPRRDRDAARDRGGRAGAPRPEGADRERESPDPDAPRDADGRARGRPGDAHGARAGQAARRGTRGDRLRALLLRV